MIRAAIIGAALLAAPAFAESWEIHTQGHWSVDVYDNAGDMGCRARVSGTGGIAFFLSFDQFGLDANLTDRNMSYASGTEGRVRFWVDRREEWGVTARAVDDLIWWDIPESDAGNEFLRELRTGARLYVSLHDTGGYSYWFNLDGSSAAMVALGDCIETIE